MESQKIINPKEDKKKNRILEFKYELISSPENVFDKRKKNVHL